MEPLLEKNQDNKNSSINFSPTEENRTSFPEEEKKGSGDIDSHHQDL